MVCGEAARQREDFRPSAVGSASIALWARHSIGARNQAFENASVIIRPLFPALYKVTGGAGTRSGGLEIAKIPR
jgi:hypothetical protein